MGKRRNFRSNTVTTPYGKKVKAKSTKPREYVPPVRFDWIFMSVEEYKEFKEARRKPVYLKEILKDKDSKMVVRGTWFLNACDLRAVKGRRLYVLRADRRDRSVEVLGAVKKKEDDSIDILRPPQPISFTL